MTVNEYMGVTWCVVIFVTLLSFFMGERGRRADAAGAGFSIIMSITMMVWLIALIVHVVRGWLA